ncbi:MAG: phosphatidylglycerophosphatase A [Gammaproteobacteria bacterium]|nr:MAG: phosphatidylglycerophosphatase A [Gammaproteobacteria bacterium]
MRPLEQPPAAVVLGNPVHLLAFGLGSGLSPVAPGTAGSLAAIPLAWLMAQAGWGWYLGLTVVALFAGFWICGRSAELLGVHDHRGIVWDEFVGQFIALFLVPWQWYWIVAGFLLFRFYDIVKPWPARAFDRHMHNGAGIVMDDVVAGLYAWASLWGLIWLLRDRLGVVPA